MAQELLSPTDDTEPIVVSRALLAQLEELAQKKNMTRDAMLAAAVSYFVCREERRLTAQIVDAYTDPPEDTHAAEQERQLAAVRAWAVQRATQAEEW